MKRTPLSNGSVLILDQPYTITSQIGSGETCLVYEAFFINAAGVRQNVLIRELYPRQIGLTRNTKDENEQRFHPVDERSQRQMEQKKEEFLSMYGMMTQISQEILPGQSVYPINLHEQNGTYYLLQNWQADKTLEFYSCKDLAEMLHLFVSACQIVQRVHAHNALVLDLKPANLLVMESLQALCLIDFDSIVPMDQVRFRAIRTTPGFSPASLALKKPSVQSDFYSLGALLFWLLFNRTPTARDGEYSASWDFSNLPWHLSAYNPALEKKLSLFFKRTLSSWSKRCFSSADELLEAAHELYKLSDQSKPYVYFSNVHAPDSFVCRKKEQEQLARLVSAYPVSAVSGMGGMGKTWLARRVLHQKEQVLWLIWKNTLIETLADDLQFHIHAIHPETGAIPESLEQYVSRKLKILKELNPETLLVFDQVPEEGTLDFSLLEQAGFHILLISRNAIEGIPGMQIGPLEDLQVWKDLYRMKTGRKCTEKTAALLDQIGISMYWHTLLMSMLCGMSRNNPQAIESIARSMQSGSFRSLPLDASDYHNGKLYQNQLALLLHQLLLENTTPAQKQLLGLLAVFPLPLDLDALQKLCPFDPADLASLQKQGLVENVVHPLIRELLAKNPQGCLEQNLLLSLSKGLQPNFLTFSSQLDKPGYQDVSLQRLLSIGEQFLPVLPVSKERSQLLCGLFMNMPFYQTAFFDAYESELDHSPTDSLTWYRALDHSFHYNLLYGKTAVTRDRLVSLKKNWSRQLGKEWLMMLETDILDEELDALGMLERENKLSRKGEREFKRLQEIQKKITKKLVSLLPKGTPEYEAAVISYVNILIDISKEKKVEEWMLQKPQSPALLASWALTLARLDPDFSDTALQICLEQKDEFAPVDQVDTIWVNLSSMFNEIFEEQKSLECLQEALKICQEYDEVEVWKPVAKRIREYMQIQIEDMNRANEDR